MRAPQRWAAGLILCVIAALGGCGGGSDAGDSSTPSTEVGAGSGRVEGVVLSSTDGSPITDASVSVGSLHAKSRADGSFVFDGVAAGSAMVTFAANGYADGLLSVQVASGRSARAEARLVHEGASVDINPSGAASVDVPGSPARVDFAANTLVRTDGTAPSGAVTVRLTPIDVAGDPRSMPGSYRSDGGQAIESMGAISVTLVDAAGRRVNLKSGSSATIRIPLASRASDPPPTIPLYYLDEASGRWVQQGTADLKSGGAQAYYEGTVTHFTVWNADRPLDSVLVNGCVNDGAGQPVAGTQVSSVGIDYTGIGEAITDAQGRFSVAIRKYGRASIIAEDSVHTSAAALAGPAGADITLPACLVLDQPPAAPTIVMAPQDVTVWEDSPAVFMVVAGGRQLRYQWQRDGVDVAGATSPLYAVPRASLADSGARFTVVVRNATASVASAGATLTVKRGDATQQAADLRMLGLGFEYAEAGFAALQLVGDDLKFIVPASLCSSGSVNATLDGNALPAGGNAPTSGTLAASFNACDVGGTRYSGSDSVQYTAAADFRSVTATATLQQLRRQSAFGAFGGTSDTTADGSLGLSLRETVAGSDATMQMTLTPGAGATLRNEASGRVATFATGGFGWSAVTAQSTGRTRQSNLVYDALRFSVDGVPYIATGNLQIAYSGTTPVYTGEIRLQSSGLLVARLYATGTGGLAIEVNGASQPW